VDVEKENAHFARKSTELTCFASLFHYPRKNRRRSQTETVTSQSWSQMMAKLLPVLVGPQG